MSFFIVFGICLSIQSWFIFRGACLLIDTLSDRGVQNQPIERTGLFENEADQND